MSASPRLAPNNSFFRPSAANHVTAFEQHAGHAAGITHVEFLNRGLENGLGHRLFEDDMAVRNPKLQQRDLGRGDVSHFQLSLNQIEGIRLIEPETAEPVAGGHRIVRTDGVAARNVAPATAESQEMHDRIRHAPGRNLLGRERVGPQIKGRVKSAGGAAFELAATQKVRQAAFDLPRLHSPSDIPMLLDLRLFIE